MFYRFQFKRWAWAKAKIGDPVAGSGKLPPDAAISKWLYFSGLSLADPYLSRPEAIIKNAAGPEIIKWLIISSSSKLTDFKNTFFTNLSNFGLYYNTSGVNRIMSQEYKIVFTIMWKLQKIFSFKKILEIQISFVFDGRTSKIQKCRASRKLQNIHKLIRTKIIIAMRKWPKTWMWSNIKTCNAKW